MKKLQFNWVCTETDPSIRDHQTVDCHLRVMENKNIVEEVWLCRVAGFNSYKNNSFCRELDKILISAYDMTIEELLEVVLGDKEPLWGEIRSKIAKKVLEIRLANSTS